MAIPIKWSYQIIKKMIKTSLLLMNILLLMLELGGVVMVNLSKSQQSSYQMWVTIWGNLKINLWSSK